MHATTTVTKSQHLDLLAIKTLVDRRVWLATTSNRTKPATRPSSWPRPAKASSPT